jgi:hypothetical protein
MKKLLIIGGISIVVCVIFLFANKNKEVLPLVNPIDTKEICFSRIQKATPEAPYSVEEKITLKIDGSTVVGEKSGTQSGPDMTNGYTGTLTGSHAGSIFVLRFDYAVEGSKQSEEEEYVLGEGVLVKLRYPLLDKGKVLVPDKSKEPIEQNNTEAPCS